MLSDKSRLLLQSIKTYTHRDAPGKLKRLIEKVHPADLGHLFSHLKQSDIVKIIKTMPDNERIAAVLEEAETEIAAEYLKTLEPRAISSILQEMYSDDAATILDRMPEEVKDAVITFMADAESKDVEERLEYAEQTAGRIMVPDFFSLKSDTSVKEAIKALQTSEDIEIVYYVYVLSEENKLVGVVSLRQLLLVPPTTLLKEIVQAEEVIAAKVNDDQEDVARMVARYNLLAIPVVDDLGTMMGIITVDDVIDIIKDEATEDMLKMAGTMATEEQILTDQTWTSVKTRSPWLLASWFGGLANFYLLGHFESTIKQVVLLTSFIPIVLGMGGNVGTQSSIIIVRGLAMRLLDSKQAWKRIFRELRVSAALGLIYGGLLGLLLFGLLTAGVVQEVMVSPLKLSLTVGFGVFFSMLVAAVVGTLCPLILDRLRIDPAIATGPLVTSSIDIFGVLVYFSIAGFLLQT
jgi:magnesium transporter